MKLQATIESVEKQGSPAERPARSPSRAPSSTPAAAPRHPSRGILRFFDIYLSLYIPFHFNALRLACPERFPLDTRPLIVCINHPSWWDPLTSILLSRFLLRGADHYAPIDAESLTRYSILAKLGLFPVEQGTPRGAVQFLRAAQHILSDPNSLLWLTPQGGFTDVRARPIVFKAGLASLIKRLDEITVVPLAYEYTFWNQARPEILTLCGQPLHFTRGKLDARLLRDRIALQSSDAGEQVAHALASTSDELATLAGTRDPSHFTTVMAGDAELGTPRRLGRSLRAAIQARQYRAEPKSRW